MFYCTLCKALVSADSSQPTESSAVDHWLDAHYVLGGKPEKFAVDAFEWPAVLDPETVITL